MKKTTLAIAVPLAVVGVAIAGAWYTGTRVEEEVTRDIGEINASIQQTGLPVSLTLLGIERGVFSSTARYQVSITGGTIAEKAGDEAKTLVFSDHIEHGPFPLSRLTSGKLMPVMAQSNFALEQTPIIAPLFEAAGGKAPFTGTVAIHYGQSRDTVLETAALQFTQSDSSLRVSPGKLSIFTSGSAMRSEGHLAEVDATFIQAPTGLPVRFALRDLRLDGDQKIDADGFTTGPSSMSIESVQGGVKDGAEIFAMRKIVGESVLKRSEKGLLDQTANYRIGTIAMKGKELGSLKLGISAHNLDGAVIKTLADAYRKITFAGFKDDDDAKALIAEQIDVLQSQALSLLDNSPTLALDELSLQTAHGSARVSLTVDLCKPDLNAGAPAAIVQSALAGLKADVKVDKALIGDLAASAGMGGRHGSEKTDPAALKQASDATAEMFSGMALRSNWVRLEGDSLTSSLSYANSQITFNGQAMSIEQFADTVGLPMGGAMDEEYEEEFEEEE